MEGAATGGTPRETVLLRGANTVCRRGGGGTPRRGAATETNVIGEIIICQHVQALKYML